MQDPQQYRGQGQGYEISQGRATRTFCDKQMFT